MCFLCILSYSYILSIYLYLINKILSKVTSKIRCLTRCHERFVMLCTAIVLLVFNINSKLLLHKFEIIIGNDADAILVAEGKV